MNKKRTLDKQNNSGTALVHGLSHDGRGIASIQNITTFIAGSLPKETVAYTIKHQTNRYHEAEATCIFNPSPERVLPACPHFGICGGCSLQHMSSDAQIHLKERTLLEQLQHFGRVIPEQVLNPLHADSYHYRRKARLGVKYVIKKNKVLVGFREKSSRYLADMTQCSILHKGISDHLLHLSQLIASLSIYQHIPQIEIAVGDVDIALVFRHLAPLSQEDINKFIHFGQQFHFHIYLHRLRITHLDKVPVSLKVPKFG